MTVREKIKPKATDEYTFQWQLMSETDSAQSNAEVTVLEHENVAPKVKQLNLKVLSSRS